MKRRLCSECGASLAEKPPQTRTCSDVCRAKRSRRLRAAKLESQARQGNGSHPRTEAGEALRDAVRGATDDQLRDVVREELQPVVRDAITEDVFRAIQDLVGLTPTVIRAITEDLASEDAVIRQRAYTLVAKYTIGHPAIATKDEEASGQMVVNFNLPRPGTESTAEATTSAVELENEDFKTCDMCGADKPLSSFVAGSDRCQSCQEQNENRAAALLQTTGEQGAH